jgi:hypothetical protein
MRSGCADVHAEQRSRKRHFFDPATGESIGHPLNKVVVA